MTHVHCWNRAVLVAVITTLAYGTAAFSIYAEEEKPSKTVEPQLPSPLTWPPGQVIFAQSEAAKKIRDALDRPVEFAFLDTSLRDIAQWIEKNHGIVVILDTESLAADGKGSELPFMLSGRFTSLANGLSLLLQGQGLDYLIKHDVLLITTKTAASQPENLSTRLYQVHDLIVAPNDPTASQPDFESIIELLESSIRQHDWVDNGGTIAHIRQFVGPGILAIIVTFDERGHRETEDLLKMLRESRLQQISAAQERQPLKARPGMGTGFVSPPGNAAQEKAPAAGTLPSASGSGTFCD